MFASISNKHIRVYITAGVYVHVCVCVIVYRAWPIYQNSVVRIVMCLLQREVTVCMYAYADRAYIAMLYIYMCVCIRVVDYKNA